MRFMHWVAQRLGINRRPIAGRWIIPHVPDVLWGFDTTIDIDDFHAACRRLDVRLVGEPCVSFSRRSIGAEVEDAHGLRSWMKVSAVEDEADEWYRDGELTAASIPDLPKPAILKAVDWIVGNYRWRALQMSMIYGRTELSQWAGDSASVVSDRWISDLVGAMAVVRGAKTERWRIRPDNLATLIKERFASDAPHIADEWYPAHGDLNWSNLVMPKLAVLDWECWGRAPRGWDAANLIAFSVGDQDLVRRLKRAFANDLETPSGRISQLAVLAQILHGFEIEWLDPVYREPVEKMAQDVLRGREPGGS